MQIDIVILSPGIYKVVTSDPDYTFKIDILDLGTWDTRREDWFPDYQVQMQQINNPTRWEIDFDLNKKFNDTFGPYDMDDNKAVAILMEFLSDSDNLPFGPFNG